VWAVVPSGFRGAPLHEHQERRVGAADRRVAARPIDFPDRRAAGGGRPRRRVLTPGYERGWLAFQVQGDERVRRRLAPIPSGWEGMSDAELAALCARAQPFQRTGEVR
jgi:hypothetical protein